VPGGNAEGLGFCNASVSPALFAFVSCKSLAVSRGNENRPAGLPAPQQVTSREDLMPVVPTTAYAPSEDALNLARSLVNDSAGAVFTDALLMPFLNSAYRGLQRELAENGVSVLTEQQDIEMDVNGDTGVTNTELSDVSSPQLPTDCLAPHMLWERATANTSDVFVPMEKFMSGGSMLNLQPSTYLRLWEWREDKVNLIGATQSITVRMRYEKVLPALTLGTDPVQIRSATDPLAFATAALAARSRGARALAQDLLATAQMATENLIERYVRPEQTKGRRRMPYSYRRRVIYL
jgi:hypothetical protein